MHLFGEDESKNIRTSNSMHVTGKSLRPSLTRQSRTTETDHLRTRDQRTEIRGTRPEMVQHGPTSPHGPSESRIPSKNMAKC